MNERRLLQIVVALAALIPIAAGATGVVLGLATTEDTIAPVTSDSHYRYLSGLLLGIGCAFMSTVPAIETHRTRFRLLTAIVVIGGFGRLLSLLLHGTPSTPMVLALLMELGVTPALALWQGRIASRAGR